MKSAAVFICRLALISSLLAATKTATFAIQGWTCGSCAASTRIALRKLDGVESVETNHGKMEVVVTYDDSKTNPEKMIQAIEKLGYRARVRARGEAAAGKAR